MRNERVCFYNIAVIAAKVMLIASLVTTSWQVSAVSEVVSTSIQNTPADTVLRNGVVVTMDDDGINTNPGTIAEAIAFKNGFIMAVGSNGDVEPWIGPGTRVMDLEGKMVLPGLIESHGHPGAEPPTVEFPRLAGDIRAGATPEDTIKKIDVWLEKVVRPHLKPGDWVEVNLRANPEAGTLAQGDISAWLRFPVPEADISRQDLDQIAPDLFLAVTARGPLKGKEGGLVRHFLDNTRETLVEPGSIELSVQESDWAGKGLVQAQSVLEDSHPEARQTVMYAAAHAHHGVDEPGVAEGWDYGPHSHITTMVNTQLRDYINDAIPGWEEWVTAMSYVEIADSGERGIYGVEWGKVTDAIFIFPAATREDFVQGTLQAMDGNAEQGITMNVGRRTRVQEVEANIEVVARGLAPYRWGLLTELHRLPMPIEATLNLYARVGPLWDKAPSPMGIQSMVWTAGIVTERWDSLFPGGCLGPDIGAPDYIKAREVCNMYINGEREQGLNTDDLLVGMFLKSVSAGWRLAGIHTVGSNATRALADLLYKVIEDTDLTIEDIRAMRHSGAHSTVIGVEPDVLEMVKDLNLLIPMWFGASFGSAATWIRDYGPEIEIFLAPARTWLDSGIKIHGEGHGGYPFREIQYAVTREYQGEVFGAREAIHRVEGLKMFTAWNAYWARAENLAGSLEPGKWADYIIIDRDFLGVPADEIGEIKVLMTAVADAVTHLDPDLANVYPQFNDKPPYKWAYWLE